jgi:hypothetical protein
MKTRLTAVLVAFAGIVGAAPPYNFSTPPVVRNQNADGTVAFVGDALTIVGGDNGSDASGLTSATFIALADGSVSFNYAYSSIDAPTFDYADYFTNDGSADFPVLIADANGESGAITFSVVTGEPFGFEVGTLDNLNGPGILVVSDLVLTTPEPASGFMFASALAALLCWTAISRRRCESRKSG